MNTIDQNDQQIFEDMKECVRRAGLPVFLMPCTCEAHPYGFASRIGNDSEAVELWAQYDAFHRFATFRFEFKDKLQSQNTGAARYLINEVSSCLATYHYFFCPDCGVIELRAGLYVPKKGFPKDKCKRLLGDLLGEIKDIYPKMITVIKDNGAFEDLMRLLRATGSLDKTMPALASTTKMEGN
jgi:hypothetical protein